MTFWLNSVRATASLWLVWPLIFVQFALLLSIFVLSSMRARECGFRHTWVFLIPFLMTRINDWEVVVIPAFVVAAVALSSRGRRAAGVQSVGVRDWSVDSVRRMSEDGVVETTFEKGDCVRIRETAGTFKPGETQHSTDVRATSGKTGTVLGAYRPTTLVDEPPQLALVQWDRQAWEVAGCDEQVTLPSFVAGIHAYYLDHVSSPGTAGTGGAG